ncbi:MAG: FAD-dependent oxidoreductase [Bacteroidia bacterium]|nr:FAD-dependent oxidoreductase [Bacteroidia bacterium]
MFVLKACIIIGGGIIGLCSAYYLQQEGHQVKVIDQSNMDAGASYVNAGYLSPSHIIPLAAPGVMKTGLKWMFNSSSPLYIKPRFNIDLLKWAWAFNKSCTSHHVKRAAPVIKDISVLSQELYDDIKRSEGFSFQYDKKGLFMLCQTDKMMEEELKMADMAQELNLEAREVSLAEINKMETKVEINAIGGVYYKCDHHTTPNEFMKELKAYLKSNGVQFCRNEKVIDVDFKNGRIESLITDQSSHKADEIILAAGSWSPFLSKKIGLKLLLQAGKGYRVNTERATGITIPAILAEAKAAVTPMHGFTRFAGTMEIAGINHKINRKRVMAISKAATDYYPEIQLNEEEIASAACGLRPVTPDGLPYIGRSLKCKNLTIATGHAMMGWSMATATGKLVQETIDDKKTSMAMDLFHPDRSF